MAAIDMDLENPLESRLGYQLRRASVAMMADLARRLAVLDLTATEASILLLVTANPAATQTEIGRALGIKRANMVPLVADLAARGWVRRERVDGRSHGLRITPSGSILAAEAERQTRAHEAHYFGDMPGAERKKLLARLNAVWAQSE